MEVSRKWLAGCHVIMQRTTLHWAWPAFLSPMGADRQGFSQVKRASEAWVRSRCTDVNAQVRVICRIALRAILPSLCV
jgi:hypothetical protein